jgi:hypothetical protein
MVVITTAATAVVVEGEQSDDMKKQVWRRRHEMKQIEASMWPSPSVGAAPKEAFDLSVPCDAEVSLILFSLRCRMYQFASWSALAFMPRSPCAFFFLFTMMILEQPNIFLVACFYSQGIYQHPVLLKWLEPSDTDPVVILLRFKSPCVEWGLGFIRLFLNRVGLREIGMK